MKYIRGIFTRSPDDQICIYHYAPADNITIENNVLFSDGGRALLIGLGTTPNSKISNITFEQYRYPSVNAMFKLTTAYDPDFGSGGIIKNILFENISYPSKGGLDTIIYGASQTDYIRYLTFRNFWIGGTKLSSSNYLSYFNISGYVTDYYIS